MEFHFKAAASKSRLLILVCSTRIRSETSDVADVFLAKDRDRGESTRDFGDWTRKGPLPDLPSRGGERRGPSDFGERRAPRDAPADDRVRDFGNWERKGPLSPLPQP